jgi:hypothetical protein
MDRRQFLVGLFGAVAVTAAGPMPKALELLSDNKFKEIVLGAVSSCASEVYMNNKGEYSLDPLPGFRPMREESDAIASQALNNLYNRFRT